MSDEPQTLRIDWVACNGYGACALAAPDLVELDDWGYPLLGEADAVPEYLRSQARRAVLDCPMLAMSLAPKGGRDRPGR